MIDARWCPYSRPTPHAQRIYPSSRAIFSSGLNTQCRHQLIPQLIPQLTRQLIRQLIRQRILQLILRLIQHRIRELTQNPTMTRTLPVFAPFLKYRVMLDAEVLWRTIDMNILRTSKTRPRSRQLQSPVERQFG